MKAKEILDEYARARRVETLCRNAAPGISRADLADLVQIVYLALLDTPADRIEKMNEAGELDFYATRIILNQWRSHSSPFHYQVRKFSLENKPLDGNGEIEQ